MTPVHIDEVDPKTRARVLEQISASVAPISGTDGGTTALAVIEDNNHSSTYTPAEMRARSIVSRMASLCDKLKTLEADIRILWLDFDNLKAGETILGCSTKMEFCEKKLHRTPRAIQYMLAGQSNPTDRPHRDPSELSSPPPAPEPVAIDDSLAVIYRSLKDEESNQMSMDEAVSAQRRCSSISTLVNHRMNAICQAVEGGIVQEIAEAASTRDLIQMPHPTPKPQRQVHQRPPFDLEKWEADRLAQMRAPEPVTNHDIEDTVLALPDLPELDEAVQNPIQHPSVNQFQSVKPAGTESHLKKMQHDWADVINPAVGRITVTASNVSSGVEVAAGRYDVLLSGVTPAMMKQLREMLSCN